MTTTANIGTAAPLLAGLNASADLAREANRPDDAARWARAARRLSAAISANFLPLRYQRTTDGRHGHDSAVTFMAPPFNTAPVGLPGALDATYRALLLPNGGLTPGNDPAAPWGGNAWTPSTALFALAWAGTGEAGEGRTGPGLGPLQEELARGAAGEGGQGGQGRFGRSPRVDGFDRRPVPRGARRHGASDPAPAAVVRALRVRDSDGLRPVTRRRRGADPLQCGQEVPIGEPFGRHRPPERKVVRITA